MAIAPADIPHRTCPEQVEGVGKSSFGLSSGYANATKAGNIPLYIRDKIIHMSPDNGELLNIYDFLK